MKYRVLKVKEILFFDCTTFLWKFPYDLYRLMGQGITPIFDIDITLRIELITHRQQADLLPF